MWGESLLRFALGGLVVSAFAVLGEVLKPKSFAGILGAAPSVAVVVLGLAVAQHGPAYGVSEARSMAVGSAALAVYSAVSAVLGTYVALFPRARLGLVLPLGLYLEFVRVPAFLLIGIWVLLQLLFSYAGPSYGAVVWWTHIAGFLFGIVFALVSREAIVRRMRR